MADVLARLIQSTLQAFAAARSPSQSLGNSRSRTARLLRSGSSRTQNRGDGSTRSGGEQEEVVPEEVHEDGSGWRKVGNQWIKPGTVPIDDEGPGA